MGRGGTYLAVNVIWLGTDQVSDLPWWYMACIRIAHWLRDGPLKRRDSACR